MNAEVAIREREGEKWDGCYGARVRYSELDVFFEDAFQMNQEAEKQGDERFSTCIWGHTGIGKTAFVKQFSNRPVVWQGRQYPGYRVHDVPTAQFEEMGDIHGIPSKHLCVRLGDNKKWVDTEVLDGYLKDGWAIDHEAGVKTMYAPPDWVPVEEGPSILFFDDWNRTSLRIVKGIMQLFQNYGMVSWQLPKGCNIVLTANPDEQDYLVTSMDSAILTRLRHVTLKPDVAEWAIWAEREKLDPRGINWALMYPEMTGGRERTNLRTLSEFFRFLRRVGELDDKVATSEDSSAYDRIQMQGMSMLDKQTVTSIVTYLQQDAELVIEPSEILAGSSRVATHTKELMSQDERRIDVVSVMCTRLVAHILDRKEDPNEHEVRNFQEFLMLPDIPDDLRFTMVHRIGTVAKRGGVSSQWILGSEAVEDFVIDLV